ncbi:MAG: alpha/beta fold hydrolase [Erysipelotrichales bacterium]|nr:MAG: alpha/beta fold hydrolase [Erysipelotrichales bacterium]
MQKKISFTSVSDGQKLSGTLFLPQQPRALVCVFHGMSEYSMRYMPFAQELLSENLAVMLIDHRGHGESLFDQTLKGHFADKDGWIRNLRDLHDFIRQTNDALNLPIFIFAHSMGTLFARSYLKRYESHVDGIYMTGSIALNPLIYYAHLLSETLAFFGGKRRPSKLMLNLTFAQFNKHVDHPVTTVDWLSHDTQNVNAYLRDEFCGFPLTAQGFNDISDLMCDAYSNDGWKVQRPNLPIRFVSGADDPCFIPGGLPDAVRHLSEVGYRWVEKRLIEGCRHEVLNEARRDEVVRDFLAWINYHLKNLDDIA